ncbi:hypothetical protein DFQ03_0600 [Maribacter caenipelagi]|uniref:Uncharacterized protein n=1 Tax=Maribacter caenipelagi TaxID=1447781 RepID=A0A4R7DBW8_9FLAO|nr:hypothetical protein [Maribacter caenipelagi]TDS18889.1 hypothetical protein DFQ03_0600 [Maribacter caenipelagi]
MKIRKTQDWLKANHHKLCSSIKKTECYKWSRWLKDKRTHVFPCVCETRNDDCIFAETYYRVWQVGQLLEQEDMFVNALLEYENMKGDKGFHKRWLNNYSSLGENIFLLEERVKIAIQKDPYVTAEVILPREEIKHLLKFKEVYWSCV